jgi:hypothetical protein
MRGGGCAPTSWRTFQSEVRGQSLGIGLPLPHNCDVDAITFAVAIRVELRFHPQLVADPLRRVTERFHDLRLPIRKDWSSFRRGLRACGF